MKRSTTEVVHDHLAKRFEGDLEADIAANYARDVVLLSSFGTFRGHDGVRESAQQLFDALGPSEFTYDHTLIDGDYGFLEWSAESDHNVINDGADSFVVDGGKIVLQTIHYTTRSK